MAATAHQLKPLANLVLPGKSKNRKPHLRKLRVDEVLKFFQIKGEDDTTEAKAAERMRRIVNLTLVDQNGKRLYGDGEMAKMEQDLGGMKVVALAMEAQEYNDFQQVSNFGAAVEAAAGN